MKGFVGSLAVLLSVAVEVSAISYTNVSEVPFYGLSPPVYPTRKSYLWATFRRYCY